MNDARYSGLTQRIFPSSFIPWSFWSSDPWTGGSRDHLLCAKGEGEKNVDRMPDDVELQGYQSQKRNSTKLLKI